MDRNKQLLREHLDKLRSMPVYSSIEINIVGIRIHLLKDKNNRIYSLIVPNKPLNLEDVSSILKLGFDEKFKKINFDKFYNVWDTDEIILTTYHILIDVLKVSKEKSWRFDLSRGMKLLLYNEPEIPNSIRIQEQKEKNNKLQNKLAKKFGINMVISLIFSIFFGLIIMNSKSLSIVKTIGLILLITFLLTFFLTQIENVQKWRWKRKYKR